MTTCDNVDPDSFGVAVKITGILEFGEHGFTADVEGFALSHPYGAKLNAVAVAVLKNGKLIPGPEIGNLLRMNTQRSPLEQALAEALWHEATQPHVWLALCDEWHRKQREDKEGRCYEAHRARHAE